MFLVCKNIIEKPNPYPSMELFLTFTPPLTPLWSRMLFHNVITYKVHAVTFDYIITQYQCNYSVMGNTCKVYSKMLELKRIVSIK